MAKRRTDLTPDKNGRYFRQLGWKMNEDFTARIQPKFYLGRVLEAAQFAYHRLGLLWDAVVANPMNDMEPLWTDETLKIADLVRDGQMQYEVPARPCPNGVPFNILPVAYTREVLSLRKRFGHVISIVPADAEFFRLGQSRIATFAADHVLEAQRCAEEAEVTVPRAANEKTLFEAIDAYAAYAPKANTKEHGLKEAERAQCIKSAIEDLPLSQFNFNAIERIGMYWRSRPKTKKYGKPLALSTITNYLKTGRRFLRWLHRNNDFSWRMPDDAFDALKANVDRLRTDEEVAALKHGVETFTVPELTSLFTHATDVERLFILLALNTASAQAEICTMRHDEIQREPAPATIKRVRRKTRVYGEFELWPDTLKAIDWFVRVRSAVTSRAPHHLMITEAGTRYDRQRIANIWNGLLDRVQKHESGFRRLSFKFLRKTAGQLVRDQSDGEISGVFLCHGQPVKSDELSDVYTNRPFHEVAKALREVRIVLQPMFDAAPNGFRIIRSQAALPNRCRDAAGAA